MSEDVVRKKPKEDRSRFEPQWADEKEEKKADRKPTAKFFGENKDPQWWDISTYSKVFSFFILLLYVFFRRTIHMDLFKNRHFHVYLLNIGKSIFENRGRLLRKLWQNIF